MRRLAFWTAFSLLACAAFVYIWTTKDPLRNHPILLDLWLRHNLRLVAHSHPAVARDAWLELWNLYHTRWAVYQRFPALVGDSTPISFLLEPQQFPAGGSQPEMRGFFASGKPIYHKAEQVCCRTVGEALLAIMYREKKWREEFQGDWKIWWDANRRYY